MSIRVCQNTHRLSVDEVLERAASVANLATLRTYTEPSSIQIAMISEYTSLLENILRSLPPNDTSARGRIRAQLDIHQAILAPIRRLPKELLIEVIGLLAYESPLRTLYIAATVACVCNVWREVVRGLTSLWTKVVVKTMDDFDGYCELFLPLTKKRLSDLRCDDRSILRLLWDAIEPYASRWRSVTLEGQISTLPDLKVIYMENLERLVVDAYDAPISAEVSVLDFVVAPNLRHLGLTIDVLQSEHQLHVPVMRALTSLVIEAMSPFPVTHTLPLLQACAGTLQSLTLKVRYPVEGPEGSYPTSTSDAFVMHALTFISLIDPACALLNHISAPLVHQLILGNVPAYGTRSLLGFLTRSQASRCLHTLRVYRVEDRDMYSWIPCFELMDNLRALHFDDLLSNREFLEILVRRADRPVLLPSLEALAIYRVDKEHAELQEIIDDMCASRAKAKQYSGGRTGYGLLGWIKEDENGISVI